jgi:DNA polymerase (family 10)
MKVSGIGPKTGYRLVMELQISEKNPLQDLQKKAEAGMIAQLEDFGEKSQEDIIRGIGEYLEKPDERMLLPRAITIADEVMEWMKKEKAVKNIEALGSSRRKAATVGDIDMAVATDSPQVVMDHFVRYPNASRTIEKGEKTASILLPGGVQVDILVIEPKAWGSALQHFTGSKHHNIALREYSLKKHLSLSENGIKDTKTEKMHTYDTEEKFYNALGLQWIPPEMREDMGEIQAALKNELPQLVELSDIRTDLQIHSDFDIETSHDVGASSMKDIVLKAAELGYEYVAVTEHNPSQKGHNEKDIYNLLSAKKKTIEQVNISMKSKMKTRAPKLFNSLEIDMLPNGDLPVSEEALELLDFALVSIHSSFDQSRKVQTARVLKALNHEKVKIFAHPTGRKINHREGVELDWPQIFDFCIQKNKWIEINADPMRLDLPDFLVKEAVDRGVLLTMGTDAHHVDAMDNMLWGISVARRGWAEAKNIVNTRSLEEFEKLLGI